MLPWRMAVVGLFYFCIRAGVTQYGTQATANFQATRIRHLDLFLRAKHWEGPRVIREETHILQGMKNTPRDIQSSSALFPSVSKMKRGATSVVRPSFHHSIADVHLLFEILLTGIHFEASGEFSVQDAELASLRKTRNLELICEEVVPKKLSEVFRLIAGLSRHTGRLHQEDFERTLLTLVYTAQGMVNSSSEHQRSMWADSFVSLYKFIKQDLTE